VRAIVAAKDFQSLTAARQGRAIGDLFEALPVIRMICWILAGALVAIVSLYGLIELHYFMRMFLTVFLARFCKKKVSILDETVVYGEFSENTRVYS